MWVAIIEFVCHCILFHHLAKNSENRICARVHDLKHLPKQKDWSDEYKCDSDTNLILNDVSTADTPFQTDFVASVDRCYCIHLRENRIKIMDCKLACYIPIGGEKRFIMVLLVPKGL